MFKGIIAAIIAATAAAAPAAAIQVEVRGTTAFVTGSIHAGDEYTFQAAITANHVTTVELDSGGGQLLAAGNMAREIRAAGLSTKVDAARARCQSACTILFAGGLHRIYLHAPSASTTSGLGFHQAHVIGSGGQFSGKGQAQFEGYYTEFGVPNASALSASASPNEMRGISGTEALSLGIATEIH